MASSVKSDYLVSRIMDVNDIDLKEMEGHESGEGEQDCDRTCCYPNNRTETIL